MTKQIIVHKEFAKFEFSRQNLKIDNLVLELSCVQLNCYGKNDQNFEFSRQK